VRPGRLALLLPGGAALLGGLNGALLLLGVAAPVGAERLADRHGVIMVLGFLGTVIALERAVALRATWGYLAPGLLGAGGLALLSPLAPVLGTLLLMNGALVLVAVYAALHRRTRDPGVLVQLLAAVLAACAAGLLLFAETAALVPWLAGFVVLTIAAERVELARLALPRGAPEALLGFASALVGTLILALTVPEIGTRAYGLVLLLLALWLARHDVARRMIRTSGLPRLSAAAMLTGYAWLTVAALTWLVAGVPRSTAVYDTVIHSVFLGFGISMVIAHVAVILPAVLGIRLPYHPTLWIPLVVLHAGMLVRIGLGNGAGIPAAMTGGSVVTVAALLVLVLTVLGLTRRGRRESRPATSAVTRATPDTDTRPRVDA